MSTPTQTVRLLLQQPYDVVIGAGVLGSGLRGPSATGALGPLRGRRAIVVIDAGVPVAPVNVLLDELRGQGAAVLTVEVPAEERRKSLAELERVLRAMSDARLERGDLLVALGGGIVGDLAGFAAAVYRRGIRWVQCPTTLLSMVDASVGGKTGVNLLDGGELRKNEIGAFHQPALVLADVQVLSSLSDRQLRCGMAECIKHGMLAGSWSMPDLLDWTEGAIPAVLSRDPAALTNLVARNVALKGAVVRADERETASGVREQLNLGHTFGHALEGLGVMAPRAIGGGPLHHGEAVALGVIAACACAAELGLCDLSGRARDAAERCGLPTRVNVPAGERVLEAMRHDKKSRDRALRLVLPTGPGRVAVRCDVPDAAVLAGIAAIRRDA
jgi:3-dehydroquinate synthetase